MSKLANLASLALASLSTTSSASTYVVDAAGGGDFTTITAAIAAAVPGDVLIVQPGSYGAFTLAEGISILGTAGVNVSGNVIVGPLPLGPRATLQGLRVDELDVHDCLAPVVVADVTVAPPLGYVSPGNVANVDVRDSRDVRLRAVTAVPTQFDYGWHGLRVASSRVELTHSHFRGRTSPDVDWWYAGPGYDALRVEGSSVVHVSLSTLEGGVGGEANVGSGFAWGGDGGAGIRVFNDARVVLTGRPSDVVRGGQGGHSEDCQHDGPPSPGIVNSGATSTVRHSGVTVLGATTYIDCGSIPAPSFIGAHELAVPLDASLQVSGGTSSGTTAVFTLRGEPGDAVRLRLGRQLALVDLPDVVEDRLLVPLRTYDLGILPASGEATFSMNLSAALPPGFLVVAQGSCGNPSGVTRLSQSVPIVLR